MAQFLLVSDIEALKKSQPCQNRIFEYGRRRNEVGQIIPILEHLDNCGDRLISQIANYSKLSHFAAVENCEKLIRCGLVSKIIGRRKKYGVTSKGRFFLNECRRYEEILKGYGLADLLYY